MLEIHNLHASVEGKAILKGIDLSVASGEVHAIMGPNGSGKSTLAYLLSGREGYQVTSGSINYEDRDLLEMEVDQRACEGIFLAFQYPVTIPGVNGSYFLKSAVNAKRKYLGLPELNAMEFMKQVKEKMPLVDIKQELLMRSVNDGFSGGEKKRNEIFQMLMLEPKLALLDETDSGLDIDALRIVASGVNHLRNPERAIILITHYQRLLDHIQPDYVHVLSDGKIIKSGDKQLALELEKKGYGWLNHST